MERQQRTISQVVNTYRDQLTNFVHETLNGSMDAIDLRRAHREMIRRLGPTAYIEGLREGGIPQEEMDAQDKAAIAEWQDGQLAHVNQYASDAVAARGDDGKRTQILSRLDMWVNSMQTIGGMGLMSAQKNKMGTWRLGGTLEHCRTCSALHGKRHRLSWYSSRGLVPQEPGSATLECKGYQCQCFISDDEGNRIVPTMRAIRFDPAQPRDEQGQWTDTGIQNKIDDLRQKIQSKTHTVDDVISGKYKVGVEGGGGADIIKAKQAGLFTMKVGNIPIYAKTEKDARPLIDYLKSGGKYGTPEFSKLLGYSKQEIEEYESFIALMAQSALAGIA